MRFITFIAYFFAEVWCVVEFADEFGIFALFFEFIISAFVGLALLASQYRDTMLYAPFILHPLSARNFINRSIFRLFGGILLIIPGIISDIFGVIFVIISFFYPIVQRPDFYANDGKTRDDEGIIDAEIIEDSKP